MMREKEIFFYSFELFSMCVIKTNSGECTKHSGKKREILRVPPLYQSAIEMVSCSAK